MIDEIRIRKAIETAISLGWTIASEVTVEDSSKECCALGACYVAEDLKIEKSAEVDGAEVVAYYDVAGALGMTPTEADWFVAGFDERSSTGDEMPDAIVKRNPQAFQLGYKLADEYVWSKK